jgi:hypothetical protein
VDFGEGQKAVTVSAIVDESGLKGRLNPRDLREINVAAQGFFVSGLEIEFLNAAST